MALYGVGARCDVRLFAHPAALPLLIALAIGLASTENYLLAVFCLGGVILASAEAAKYGFARVLASKTLVYGGEISYAFYMVHLPVASVFFLVAGKLFGFISLGLVALATAIAIGTAIAAHHLIELPARNLILRYAARPNKPLPVEQAAE